MKKMITMVLLILMVLAVSIGALAAETKQILRLTKEDILNNKVGNTLSFNMLGEQSIKELEIDEEAIAYLIGQKMNLTVVMPKMTVTIPPTAFQGADWQEAVSTREPLRVRLKFRKGDTINVTDNFDQWTYGRLGMYRVNGVSYEITAQILAGVTYQKDLTAFAAPLALKITYPFYTLDSTIKEDNLGIYLLDPDTKKWDYLGGKVDTTKKTISLDTKKTGLMIAVSANKQAQTAVAGFSDLAGHWAATDILFMKSKGVVRTSSSGKFFPDQAIIRADFVVFLVRTLNIPENLQTGRVFSDLSSEKVYYPDVITAINAGLISGIDSSHFAPNQPITRQEMAALLTRALDYAKLTKNENGEILEKFLDREKIAEWAEKSAAIAVNAGLIGGRAGSLFAPAATTTRAEAIVILHRLYDLIN